MSGDEELSALRREVVTLRLEAHRLAALVPRRCFGPERCIYLNTKGVFPRCRITGHTVGPLDYCSRHSPISNPMREKTEGGASIAET